MSKVKKSIKALFLGNLISKAIAFIGTIVLARLLFPEDYGYLVIAMIFTGFIQTIGDMGFEIFYLQEKFSNKEQEHNVLNITFKLRVLVNSVLFMIQYLGSYLVEQYFDEKMVGEMLRIYSFEYLITASISINLYILRKELEYTPEVYANMGRDFMGTIAKILFASFGFGALSFAYASVLGNLVRALVILKFQMFKPDIFYWNTDIFKKVYFFGKHSLIGGIAMYFSNTVDKMIMTTFFPAKSIGFYSFGASQASLISSYLLSPQGSLITSFIANNKENPAHLVKLLANVAYFICLILIPINFILYFYADLIFSFVFGIKWLASIPLFNIFLLSFTLVSLLFPISSVLTAYGYPHVASKIMIAKLIVVSIVLYVTVNISDSILIYAVMTVIISSMFNFIKAGIGLYLIGERIIDYLISLKDLLLVCLGYVGLYYLLTFIDVSQVMHFTLYTVTVILWSFVFHFYLFNTRFIELMEVFFGEKSKISLIVKKLSKSPKVVQ